MKQLRQWISTASISLALLGGSSAVFANHTFDAAIAAHKAGDRDRAYELFKVSAESGSAKSKYMMCLYYQEGYAVAADAQEAYQWCKAAAEQQLPEALYELGLMYLEGRGVHEDEDRAIGMFWKAADGGYAQASEILQHIYSFDFGVGC